MPGPDNFKEEAEFEFSTFHAERQYRQRMYRIYSPSLHALLKVSAVVSD